MLINGTRSSSSAGWKLCNKCGKPIKLENAFEVGVEEFKPNSNNITVYIKNLVNFNFNSLHAKFSSPFFNFEKDLVLSPHEKETFEITVDKASKEAIKNFSPPNL